MRVTALDASGQPVRVWPYGAKLRLEVAFSARKPMWKPAVDLAFYDIARTRLFSIQSDRLGESSAQGEGRWVFRCDIENPGFTLGELVIDAGLREGQGEYLVLQIDAVRLATDLAGLPEGASTGSLLHPRLTHRWETAS